MSHLQVFQVKNLKKNECPLRETAPSQLIYLNSIGLCRLTGVHRVRGKIQSTQRAWRKWYAKILLEINNFLP